MTDYISREAVLNEIGELFTICSETMPNELGHHYITEDELKIYCKRINSLPAADVVEVVRCWECELWNDWDQAGHKELGNFVCSCAYWSNEDGYVVYTAPDDYCRYGERKDGDVDG